MKKYIFVERSGIHIIDLQKTLECIHSAVSAIRTVVLRNQSVLFVGTKKQAQQTIKKEAEDCGMFYVDNRWLGGTLTNFATIKNSLLRLKKLEKMEVDGTYENLTKREVIKLNKEQVMLEKNIGGIKDMKELPGIVYIVDPLKEAIAVAEARRLKIPIVAIVDTNCNPDLVNYPMPGNDDAIRAINLFTGIVSEVVREAENEKAKIEGGQIRSTIEAGNVESDLMAERDGEEGIEQGDPKGDEGAQKMSEEIAAQNGAVPLAHDEDSARQKPSGGAAVESDGDVPDAGSAVPDAAAESAHLDDTPKSTSGTAAKTKAGEVSSNAVKTLRDRTGAGIMDCKRALNEAQGDEQKAERILKEMGLVEAARRVTRDMNEGRIFTSVEEKSAIIVEIACETDFVARSEEFVGLGESVLQLMRKDSIAHDDPKVQALIAERSVTIKENINARRSYVIPIDSDTVVSAYVHGDSGTMGALIKLKIGDEDRMNNELIQELAFNLVLHIVAFRPLFISQLDIDSAHIKEQEEIFKAQANKLDKPANVIEGIVEGKLKKHKKQICLLDQPFVKDEKQNVSGAIADIAAQCSTTIDVIDFKCFGIKDDE